MKRLTYLLLGIAGFTLLMACAPTVQNAGTTALPTVAPTAALDTAVRASQSEPIPLPPTNTPISVQIEAGFADALPVDTAVAEIDQSVCARVQAAQAELQALREQGQDVAELEAAVAELKAEYEQCP